MPVLEILTPQEEKFLTLIVINNYNLQAVCRAVFPSKSKLELKKLYPNILFMSIRLKNKIEKKCKVSMTLNFLENEVLEYIENTADLPPEEDK
jgi:hypothetical protein